MKQEIYQFGYEVYESSADLAPIDHQLFEAARNATANAYAPYSEFYVGAAARLANGELVTGGNQENASFPAGLCAEGVVLATAAAQFPGIGIESIAITFRSQKSGAAQGISPCGICRQSMQEQRARSGRPIRLIMGGARGPVTVVNDAADLLPLAFRF